MASPLNRWDTNLQNSSQLVRNSNYGPTLPPTMSRNAPVLPPRPQNNMFSNGINMNSYNSYSMPYSALGGYGGYGGYNSYGSYGSYGMPYRSPYDNRYFGNYPADDAEQRFIQYAEDSSRNTFASVERFIRAFNSVSLMLDNTFFAMTSSFRAVLSVAENFGRLRNMFGHIWYSVNVFRFITWAIRKLKQLLGWKAPPSNSAVWKEAAVSAGAAAAAAGTPECSWGTLALMGVLISAPYLISKALPKYIDRGDPANWKSPGVQAKAVFDFVASNADELTIHVNDLITLAPSYIQEEMRLRNSGWAFAVFNGKSGVVPLNYLVISAANRPQQKTQSSLRKEPVPVPRVDSSCSNDNNYKSGGGGKSHTKRVSFGENQIFEDIDIGDYRPDKSCRNEKVRDVDVNVPKTTDESKNSTDESTATV